MPETSSRQAKKWYTTSRSPAISCWSQFHIQIYDQKLVGHDRVELIQNSVPYIQFFFIDLVALELLLLRTADRSWPPGCVLVFLLAASLDECLDNVAESIHEFVLLRIANRGLRI